MKVKSNLRAGLFLPPRPPGGGRCSGTFPGGPVTPGGPFAPSVAIA